MTEEEKKITSIAETVAIKMLTQKPKWFENHEKSDDKEFGDIKQTLDDQNVDYKELHTMLNDLVKSQNDYHEASAPMLEWFKTMTMGKMFRLNFLKATGLWTGVIIGLSTVLGIIWVVIKFAVNNAISVK